MDNTEAVEKLEEIVLEREGALYSADIIAQAILDIIQADPLAYVKPKPLVWVHVGVVYASTSWGDYEIEQFPASSEFEKTEYGLCFKGAGLGTFPTLEAAQAAAETHRNEMLAKEFAE